jgi:hypothetical protein
MLAAVFFQPMFLYVSFGVSGVVAFSRLVLGWATESS